jgi:TPR repeat protein
MEPDLQLAFRSFQVRPARPLTTRTTDNDAQETTDESANATAQFMLGYMYAAGLQSIPQDQTEVSALSS